MATGSTTIGPSMLAMFLRVSDVCVLTLQLIEAVVLPMTHKDRFQTLGIQPPKGQALNTLFTPHC